MKCPHCLQGFHESWDQEKHFTSDEENYWSMRYCTCPSCHKAIIQLGKIRKRLGTETSWSNVYPKSVSRSPIPPEVDDSVLIDDYKEACLVLADSSKASAALSRRCLQHLLREKAGVKHSDLSSEIDEVLTSNKLPADLADNLDCVRSIGNFAAHPIKSKNSGEILDVETGEAEWNLDVVEELMDFYFVRPARGKNKKIALNAKLKEAGKAELPIS